MKQHITQEQWRELDKPYTKGKYPTLQVEFMSHIEELSNVFEEYEKVGALEEMPHELEYLPTIGQMIEFLDNHEWWATIERTEHPIDGWRLFEDPTGTFEKEELADALWEAVKEILENK